MVCLPIEGEYSPDNWSHSALLRPVNPQVRTMLEG
jgi:hypothetical protein